MMDHPKRIGNPGIRREWGSAAISVERHQRNYGANLGLLPSDIRRPGLPGDGNGRHKGERTKLNVQGRTWNVERRTLNAERRTPNVERRTPNAQRRTLNVERSTPNVERRTLNVERSTRGSSGRRGEQVRGVCGAAQAYAQARIRLPASSG